MNILLIAVLAFILIEIIAGYAKGFVKTAFSLVSLLVVVALVGFLSPMLSEHLKQETGVYLQVKKACQESIEKRMQEQTAEPENQEEALQMAGIKLPKALQEKLLETDIVEEATASLTEKIATRMADVIIDVLSYIVTFIVLIILVKIAEGVLEIIAKLPVLRSLNHFLGMLMGLMRGMVILWLCALVLAISCTSDIGQMLIAMVYDSPVLTALYENNGILILWSLL